MKVDTTILENGYSISLDGLNYDVIFPEDVWGRCPETICHQIIRNLAPIKTVHLQQFLNINSFYYNTAQPDFLPQLLSSLQKMIPFCANQDGITTERMLQDFMSICLTFSKKDKFVDKEHTKTALKPGAVINLSFGKDSLLTYGLARELKWPTTLVMSLDADVPVEQAYKIRLAKRFMDETGNHVYFTDNQAGVIHSATHWGVPFSEWGIFHQMTEFCFHSVPYALRFSRQAILFGNENSCNDFYTTYDGYRAYPVYDQSSEWVGTLSKMTDQMVKGLKVFSLIEPIHELSVIKVLHNRYPDLARYQMSCFPDDHEAGKYYSWCGHCSKCARIFIYLAAHGIDPLRVGLVTNMLAKGKEYLFSVFEENNTKGYDASGCNRDEQLLAFLMASRQGFSGRVMEYFNINLREEAQRRESELTKKYLGIHAFQNVPEEYRASLIRIFQEEGITLQCRSQV